MKYIYLINIENTDLYKIGFTKQDPNKRLKALQTGNPYKLKLTRSYKSSIAPSVESVMHTHKKHKKHDSEYGFKLIGEWFLLDQDDVNGFLEQCKNIEDGLNAIRNSTLFD